MWTLWNLTSTEGLSWNLKLGCPCHVGGPGFQIRLFSDGYLSVFRRTWHFRIFSGDIKEAYLVTCLLLARKMGQKSQWHLWNRPMKWSHHQHCAWACRLQLNSTKKCLLFQNFNIETKFRPGRFFWAEWDFLALNRLCGTWKLPSVKCNQKLPDIFYSHLTLFSINWSEFSTAWLEIIIPYFLK